MQSRRRFRQTDSLSDRLATEALRLRDQAAHLPDGAEGDALKKRAQACDSARQMDRYLRPTLIPSSS